MPTDILFANPLYISQSRLEQEVMTPYFPLGLLYLASYVRAQGYSVAAFDGTFGDDETDFERALSRVSPRYVCLTSLVTTRPMVQRMARLAKGNGAVVIAGGADPTRDPGAYIELGLNVVVVNEGEVTLVELLRALDAGQSTEDLASLPGIAYRGADGQLVTTAQRDVIRNLDALPYPARDLIDLEPYMAIWREVHGYSSLTLAASRGCPYGCEWCGGTVIGPHFRMRSPSGVAAEIRVLKETYRPERLRFVDDLSGFPVDWFHTLYDEAVRLDAVLPFEALLPFDAVDIPMFEPVMDFCAKRNLVIPTAGSHPHAPPEDLDQEEIQSRLRTDPSEFASAAEEST